VEGVAAPFVPKWNSFGGWDASGISQKSLNKQGNSRGQKRGLFAIYGGDTAKII